MGKKMAYLQSGDPLIANFIKRVRIRSFDSIKYYDLGGMTLSVETVEGKKITIRTTGKMSVQEIVEKIVKELHKA